MKKTWLLLALLSMSGMYAEMSYDIAKDLLAFGGKNTPEDNLKALQIKLHPDRITNRNDTNLQILADALEILKSTLSQDVKDELPMTINVNALKNLKDEKLKLIADAVFKLLGEAKDVMNKPQQQIDPNDIFAEIFGQLKNLKDELEIMKKEYETIPTTVSEDFKKKLLGYEQAISLGNKEEKKWIPGAYESLFIQISATDTILPFMFMMSQEVKNLMQELIVLTQQISLNIMKNLLNLYVNYNNAEALKEAEAVLTEIYAGTFVDQKHIDTLKKMVADAKKEAKIKHAELDKANKALDNLARALKTIR